LSIELQLRPGEERRIRAGHPWLFSNELVTVPGLAAGDEVVVRDAQGRFVGRGDGHPQALIAARLLSRREDENLDDAWLRGRLRVAMERRRRWLPDRRSFRWVHGEADGLGGLVIDAFHVAGGLRAVVQCGSAGMARRQERVLRALREEWDVEGCVLRNDGRGRVLEGLPEERGLAWGQEGPWTVEDLGIPTRFDPLLGQKTGLFLDMAENRRRMAAALGQGRALDLFAYVGQWGQSMARAGASDVVAVDSSAAAVAFIGENARLAGLDGRLRGVEADIGSFLDGEADRSWDGIVCDPPALIQSRKAVAEGSRAYLAIFTRALRKVRPGGLAVLASCSHHLWDERFGELVTEAGRRAGRRLTLVLRGEQSPCHPVPLGFPEARYLKCWLLEVQ
jgi:23S rRNA (cytosine1962-C5)-methyltransferase